MKRLIITGVAGFVGHHLLDYLSENHELEILGLDVCDNLETQQHHKFKFEYVPINLLDDLKIFSVVDFFKPDSIIHLASSSSVAYSWENPVESFRNNTNVFLNLVETIRKLGLKTRIISVGSSEEYGIVDKDKIPLAEDFPINPVSPYAVARVSQELLSRVYVKGYGMDIILTRSFNHIGPGQKTAFFIPSIAQQLLDIKAKNLSSAFIDVGDLSIVRDFTDVRDVVKAYCMLLEKGKAGEVYNICSNKGYQLSDVVNKLIDISKAQVIVRIDKQRIRPADNPVIIGNNSKIVSEIGWKPTISFDQSLIDVMNSLLPK